MPMPSVPPVAEATAVAAPRTSGPDFQSLPALLATVAPLLGSHLRQAEAGEGPVIRQPPLATLAATLDADRWIREGGLHGEALAEFVRAYLAATTRLHHPGYFAHQVALPHPAGAIGALLDGALNNPMGIYEMGPPAATLEMVTLNWMLEKVGWNPPPLPPQPPVSDRCRVGGGVLTHGGSLATLTALAAARSRCAPEAWSTGTPGDLVVLAPAASHYAVARAVGILGLGQQALRPAPCDADGRLDPQALPQAVAELRAAGKRIMAVVANACSTASGLYDPLRPVGEFCRAEGLWLHVDGAHGASALVSPTLRRLLDGVELADSLVWDAHKMLQTPTVCAAVLVRDGRTLDHAFQEEASYLFHDKDQPGIDLLHRTVECTKAALGLRLFLVLAAEGEAGIARHVEGCYARAGAAARQIAATPGFRVAASPQANIVCFRWERAGGTATDDDADLLDLRRTLLAEGDFYLSSTLYRGQRWLRLVFMNPAAPTASLDRLLVRIGTLAAEMSRKSEIAPGSPVDALKR